MRAWTALARRARDGAALWTVAVQALEVGAQVGTSLVVARVLGPAALGELAFALNLVGLAAVLLLFGAQDVLLAELARGEARREHVLGAGFTLLLGGAAAASLVVGTVCAVVGTHGTGLAAALLALLALLGNGLASLFNLVIVAAGASRRDVPRLLISRVLLLGAAAGGAGAGSVVLAVGGYALSSLVLAALRADLVARLGIGRPVFHRGTLVSIWRQSRSVGMGHLFGVVSSRSDLILLSGMRSSAEVGLYGAAYRLLHAAGQGATAIALALFPGVARARGTRGQASAARRFIASGAGLALALLLVATLGDWPLGILYGPAFVSAAPLLPILLAAGALQTLDAFLAKLVVVRRRSAWMPWAQGMAAATNLIVNVTLIPEHGVRGAAWATLAAECVLCGVLLGALGARRPPTSPG